MKKTYLVLVFVFLSAAFSVAALDLEDISIEATDSCGGGAVYNSIDTNHLGQNFIANHSGLIKLAKINSVCQPGLTGNRTFCWDIRDGNWSSNGNIIGSGCSQVECNTTGIRQIVNFNANITKGNKYFLYMSTQSGEWIWKMACSSKYPNLEAMRYKETLAQDSLITSDLQVNFTTSTFDSDGDLIADEDDSCPAIFGLPQLNGCPDSESPAINLIGDNPQLIGVGTSYVELGAASLDNIDGDLSTNISIDVSEVNTGVVGNYLVYYSSNDSTGNFATINRTINIIDIASPIITLIGSNPQSIEYLSPYIELGAIATDNVDGNISGNIIIDSSVVNTSILGIYNVTYNVNDSNGNNADQKIRTVNVIDTTIPVISIVGITPVNVEVGSSYADAGATSSDNYDGDLTASVVTVNPVDVNIVGSYLVTYSVKDSSNNSALQVNRTVNVADTQVPVITLIGGQIVNLTVGAPYVDGGATASDNYDGNITADVIVVNPVNISLAGQYLITYNAKDSNNNDAVQVTRTANILSAPDTTAPVISLIGGNPQIIEIGTPYSELGATAVDNIDGDISGDIIIDSSAVNISLIGSYNVTYDVSDSSGNPAIQIQRTVNIIEAADTIKPIVAIVSPLDQDYENEVLVNVSITDENLDSFYVSVDGTKYFTELFTINPSLGGHNLIAYANDTAGNFEQKEVNFTIVDLTAPTLTLSYSSGILKALTNENATCYYNTTTSNLTKINENETTDNQVTLNLPYGTHNYYIECFDGSNNKVNSTLNIVLSAPPVVVSNGGGNSGGSSSSGGDVSISLPPSSKENIIISEVRPNEPKEIKINNKEITIKEIHIEVNNQIKNIDITIRKETGLPAAMTKVTGKSNEEIYQFLSISHPNLENENIKKAEISFEVDKKWIKEKNVNEDSISLNRYVDGEWQKLNTHKAIVNIDKIMYTAETPGFSIFAVTGENNNLENSTEESSAVSADEEIAVAPITDSITKETNQSNTADNETVPSEKSNGLITAVIGVIAVIVVMIIAGTMIFRKKEKQKEEINKKKNKK